MQLRKRILGTLADVAIARPWTVCAVAALVALVSVVLIAVFGLQVESSRSALWPDDHPLQKRFRAFEGEFGSSFQLIVAIESDDPTKNKEVAERVAARIRDEVPVIESVLYKLDFAETLDRAPDLAPLYADVDDLREGARWVAKLAPAQPAKQDVKLGGLVGMLERANGELDGLEEGETKALSQLEDHIGDVFDGAGALFDEIDTWLDEPERREFRQVEETISGQAAEMLEKAGFGPQGYLADDSGRLLVLMCQPDEARDDLPYLLSFVEPIRAIAQEEQASNPGVTVGLTGMPVFSTEEMGVINTDLSFITVVSAVGVLLLFVLGYGSLWNTLFIALTLVLGVLVDLAFTASCVGSVNLVSSLFVAVLLGLGIDYGIQLITRLQDELRGGATAAEAVRTAVVHTGEGVLTGGVTTAVAFFTMALGEFKPLIQLGIVGGAGILLVLLASFVFLPAQLVLHARRHELRPSTGGLLSGRWRLPVLPLRGRLPALVVTVSALLGTVLIALPIRPVTFSNDQLSMLPQDLPSVQWLRKLEKSPQFSSTFNASIAPDLETARKREEAFNVLSSVSRVQSLATYLPEGQEEKGALISQMRTALRRLPRIEIGTPRIDVAALVGQLESLHEKLELDLPFTLNQNGVKGHDAKLKALDTSLVAIISKIKGMAPGDAAVRLGSLQASLDRWADRIDRFIMSDAVRMTPEVLPSNVRRLVYAETDAGPRFLLRVYPSGDVNDDAFMERFLEETRGVDPEITGYSVNYYEFGKVMQKDFKMAFLYAVIAIIILLSFDLRRPVDVLLALIPLGIGGVWMVGVMNLMDIKYNLANIMAIPLIVGIGVAYGVYVIHRVRETHPPQPRMVVATTGKAVLFSALTTMVSFGAMSFASHRGASGLGTTLLFGIAFCLLASLGVLPALLRLKR